MRNCIAAEFLVPNFSFFTQKNGGTFLWHWLSNGRSQPPSFPLGSRVLCVARTFLVASFNPGAAVERLITRAKIGAWVHTCREAY